MSQSCVYVCCDTSVGDNPARESSGCEGLALGFALNWWASGGRTSVSMGKLMAPFCGADLITNHLASPARASGQRRLPSFFHSCILSEERRERKFRSDKTSSELHGFELHGWSVWIREGGGEQYCTLWSAKCRSH
ncbi:hypothetical protein MPTK1_8g06390 [Marchantia polymorpha subsp. ruderalis]|uniref:Uncharacterized protein n=1 Tax=Marchantia polymorpha TaxID=3197 RepID=A0A2R6XIQ4_MARPO|nr:hypothetical protein MARPO_0013s0151 [Marchantia polymorpha]BBN18895.1 hypothetical protein Mp_8g06390 [Marchantia polymorpha subsp. ruderalis]|eukprot:PTQ45949.1 hypothetical protein MARPO_0013s0151 [Marchantia polymorpha]